MGANHAEKKRLKKKKREDNIKKQKNLNKGSSSTASQEFTPKARGLGKIQLAIIACIVIAACVFVFSNM